MKVRNSLIASGMTPIEILAQLFVTIPHKATGNSSLSFRCMCSKKKMKDVLKTLSKDDIAYLLDKDDGIDVKCDYCSEHYLFERKDLDDLFTH